MLKKIAALFLSALLLAAFAVPACASGEGFFGIMAQEEDADERLSVLEQVAEPLSVSLVTKSGIPVEIGQAYFEGDRVFVSYRIGANTDLIGLHEGAPEGEISWDSEEENWILGEIPAYYPDMEKENNWLDGKGQRWLTSPRAAVLDGLELEGGAYADIIDGMETRQPDGSVIGWKTCVVPEEADADTLTFTLGIASAVATKFQDGSTFRESFGTEERENVSFTVTRNTSLQLFKGASSAETCPAAAELSMGKVDIRGFVTLSSPEQAASWAAWQNGEDESETDVILSWSLYQNGELLSPDLYGASWVDEEESEVVFEVLYPLVDNPANLSLVPEYAQAGENPAEAIALAPAAQ